MGNRISLGTTGQIVNVDNRRAAAEFAGARAKVLQRLYRPDGVVVELLDDGPVWHRGQTGEVALRYFVPDARKTKPTRRSRDGRSHTRVKTMREAPPSERDFQQAAKLEMRRFGLTMPEALLLVKDKRYPSILTMIDEWRGRHGWPAASSPLSRGYVFELLGKRSDP